MPVYLDDELVPEPAANLAVAIEAAQKRLAATGRVVVEVKIDGQAMNDADLVGEGRSLTPAMEVRFYSADPCLLASSVLGDVRVELGRAREAQSEAARLFQHDQPADAMRAVGRAIEVWQMAEQGLIQSTAMAGLDLDRHQFEEKAVSAFLAEIIEKIRQLRDLIVSGDTVGLADTLGYEWPELTNRLDDLIGEIIVWIDSTKK